MCSPRYSHIKILASQADVYLISKHAIRDFAMLLSDDEPAAPLYSPLYLKDFGEHISRAPLLLNEPYLPLIYPAGNFNLRKMVSSQQCSSFGIHLANQRIVSPPAATVGIPFHLCRRRWSPWHRLRIYRLPATTRETVIRWCWCRCIVGRRGYRSIG